MTDAPRTWQTEMMADYNRVESRLQYLVAATPGSGKTHAARMLARDLLDQRKVDQVIVVVPTDALRQQWADSRHLQLWPVASGDDLLKRDYEGFVVTYQQVGGSGVMGDLLRKKCASKTTLVLLDELHHAGDGTSWGDGLRRAFEPAARRLALTGTPWRQDKTKPIPFVTYGEDGTVLPDFVYGYAQAVQEGVCRSVVFHSFDGQGRWADGDTVVQGDLGGDLTDDQIRPAMRAVLLAKEPWMKTVLKRAAEELETLRAESSPDAGCLVVAEGVKEATEYAALWRSLTGHSAALVVSEDAAAQTKISRFRNDASARCIVAVRMVSEGIDIPRLAVCVYATPILTPLFFRQVVGRLVRRRPNEEHHASVLMPAVRPLMTFAREIEEELRHALEEDLERARKAEQVGLTVQSFTLTPLSSSDAVEGPSILSGQQFTMDELAAAQQKCQAGGLPERYAPQLAAILRASSGLHAGAQITVVQPAAVEPQHVLEGRVKGEITRLVGKVAYRDNVLPAEINRRFLSMGFPPRGQCTLVQLEKIRERLLKALSEPS